MNVNFPLQIEAPTDMPELLHASRLWLFLDYDGTLAGFAPTPDDVLPDQELINLLDEVSNKPSVRTSIISGRRLSHILELLPLDTVLLAGSYGLEMRMYEGQRHSALDYEEVRPVLAAVKPHLEALLQGRQGFYLEDKGWSLAIHARFADEAEAELVIDQAVPIVQDAAQKGDFRILGGERFLEIGPALAGKGHAVRYLLERFPWPEALLVYIGDDDKDEEAYQVIQEYRGVSIQVAERPRLTIANYRLDQPSTVRRWLADIRDHFPFNRTELATS